MPALRSLSCTLALALAAACSSNAPNSSSTAPIPVDHVTVSPPTPSLSVGQSTQLTATAYDKDGNVLSGRTITWQTDAPAVATVSGSGMVDAVAAGSAHIEATAESKTGSATVSVTSGSTPGPTLTKVSGDGQTATMGAPLGAPLVVKAVNGSGAALAGATITWSVTTGGGTLSAGSSTTNSSGLAQVQLTIGGTFMANSVNASLAGGNTVAFGAYGNGSGDFGGRRFFPNDNDWNRDISGDPVDPLSDSLVASCGATRPLHPDFGTVYAGAPNGIPYVIVHSAQPKVPVSFDYADESDPGPYPVPPYAPIEGGASSTGDRHVLVVDWEDWRLYEMFDSHPVNSGQSWTAGSGALFDLGSDALRPAGWTSADAAGLPILPGLVRYDEVVIHHLIAHALRFTCPNTRRAYVFPARHYASSNTSVNLPPMGARFRLKASVDISGFSPNLQVILSALKKYGMYVADNGSGFFLSGAPDPRWSDDELHALTQLHGSDFEVVKMGPTTP